MISIPLPPSCWLSAQLLAVTPKHLSQPSQLIGLSYLAPPALWRLLCVPQHTRAVVCLRAYFQGG